MVMEVSENWGSLSDHPVVMVDHDDSYSSTHGDLGDPLKKPSYGGMVGGRLNYSQPVNVAMGIYNYSNRICDH